MAFCGCRHLSSKPLDQTSHMAPWRKEGVLALLPDGVRLWSNTSRYYYWRERQRAFKGPLSTQYSVLAALLGNFSVHRKIAWHSFLNQVSSSGLSIALAAVAAHVWQSNRCIKQKELERKGGQMTNDPLVWSWMSHRRLELQYVMIDHSFVDKKSI